MFGQNWSQFSHLQGDVLNFQWFVSQQSPSSRGVQLQFGRREAANKSNQPVLIDSNQFYQPEVEYLLNLGVQGLVNVGFLDTQSGEFHFLYSSNLMQGSKEQLAVQVFISQQNEEIQCMVNYDETVAFYAFEKLNFMQGVVLACELAPRAKVGILQIQKTLIPQEVIQEFDGGQGSGTQQSQYGNRNQGGSGMNKQSQ